MMIKIYTVVKKFMSKNSRRGEKFTVVKNSHRGKKFTWGCTYTCSCVRACVFVCACVRARVRMRIRVYVCVCVYVCACVVRIRVNGAGFRSFPLSGFGSLLGPARAGTVFSVSPLRYQDHKETKGPNQDRRPFPVLLFRSNCSRNNNQTSNKRPKYYHNAII